MSNSTKIDDRRRTVRIQSTAGLVILRSGNAPPVTCRLEDLSEGGCRVTFNTSETWTPQTINKFIRPGITLDLVISVPPYLERFAVSGEARMIKFSEDQTHVELGLKFKPMEPKICGVLRQALLKLATERLRSGRTPVSATELQEPAPLPPIPGFTPSTPLPPPPSTAMFWRDQLHGKKVGDVLIKMGKLTEEQLAHAIEESRHYREKLGQILIRRGLVKPADLLQALALSSGLPKTDLSDMTIKPVLRRLFTAEMMNHYQFIPFDMNEKMICVACAAPLSENVIGELKRMANKRIEVFLAQEDMVLFLLQQKDGEELPPSAAPPVAMSALGKPLKQRKFTRHKASMQIKFYYCTSVGDRFDDATYTATTVDISEGGFRVEGPRTEYANIKDFDVYGLYLYVSASLPPHDFQALCKPVYVLDKDPAKEKSPVVMGMKIMDMSQMGRHQLKQAIELVLKMNGTKIL